MPADRKKTCSTRRPKQQQPDDDFNLQWTVPVTDFLSQNIEFTTNITPNNFTDDATPPLQPHSTYIFPPEEVPALLSSDNSKSRGRKGSGYIPRPPNAFILFRSSFIKSQHVTSEVETNHSTLSKIIGMTWQNLPHDERQAWHAKAKEAQEEHRRKFPSYAFKPASHKVQRKKRRVRETEPKDIKRCEKIVELLCNGKKGHELNVAVKDFDRSHVPEFITRFEAPITARAYRRSSSAPLPDTEHAHARQSFLPPSSSVLPERRRSSSTEPELLCPSSSSAVPASGVIQFDPSYSLKSELHPESLIFKQDPEYIDFSSFSFENQHQLANNSYPPLDFAAPTDFTLTDYTIPVKLSITTTFLNEWNTSQASPMPSIPSSPCSGYYSASSPSDIQTPFNDGYPMPSQQIMDDPYTFNPLEPEQGYTTFMDRPESTATSASSPDSTTYYPEYISLPVMKEHDVYGHQQYQILNVGSQLEMDYSTFMHEHHQQQQISYPL